MARYHLLILNSLLLLTLLGSHLGRRIESASAAHSDFLRELSLPFRDWKTSDHALSASELSLLEPDATLLRHYQAADGPWAELAIIAGHRKKSIHTPGACMPGGGWDTLTQQPYTISLPGRDIPAMRMLMSKDGHQRLVTYFFTNGDYSTGNLIQFQGVQMLKRFQSRIPVGALVRMIVPVVRDQAEAEKVSNDFAKATLPGALAALRQAHVDLQ